MNPAPVRTRDLPSALLLTLIVGVASQRLVATGWSADMEIVLLLALAGVFLGLPLGLSRFQRSPVFLLTLLYSLVMIPFTIAAVLYHGLPWLERMSLMGGRLLQSLSTLAVGDPLEDAFLFLFLFSICFWFIGAGSAYAMTRSGSFVGAVLPGGVVIVLLQVFDARGDKGVMLTALFIFVVLLLLGRMNYARRREVWRGWRVFPTGEVRTDINLNILAVASVLVLTAWLLPVSSRHIPVVRVWWQDLTNLWARSETLTNLFAGLEIDEKSPVNEFYGQYLALGRDAPLSETTLFHIQNLGIAGQERYYWRARSYDVYEEGIWGSSPVETRDFTPRSQSLQLPEGGGVDVEFRVFVLRTNFGTLVTPARPVWVNRPARLTYLPVSEQVEEPLLFRANEPVQPGEEYLVHAILLEPTGMELRLAGTDYPDWVYDRYLQLPTDLPPAIINLATSITAGAKTPYDKAEAITAYLREEIVYNTHMEPVPAGRDVLAWFLFDYKQGFCNYYASAEVILLRTVGVPARLAVGFSEGEFEVPGWYTVRQQDAHAWPEVYFPGFGWVEFEPTASEPVLVRAEGEITGPPLATLVPVDPQAAEGLDLPAGAEGDLPAGAALTWPGSRQDAPLVSLVLVVAILLLGKSLARVYTSGALERDYRALRSIFNAPVPILVRNWLKKNSLPIPAWLERQAWMAGLNPLARAFTSVYNALRDLGPPASPALTPAEAAAALRTCLPEAGEDITILLEEYQPAFYGTSPANLKRVRAAATSLRRKARQAHRDGWLNRRMNGGKFLYGKKISHD